MLREQSESYIGDYLASEHLLFLAGPIKEYAGEVLTAFFTALSNRGHSEFTTIKAKEVEAVLLEDMPRLALPSEVRRAIPEVLTGFFDYLKNTGRYPGAGVWAACSEALGGRFAALIRDDGSVRGETFRKKVSDVGRNDPCPCGSGKKYKKCCGPLNELLA